VKDFVSGNGMSISKYTIPIYFFLLALTVHSFIQWKNVFSRELHFLLLFLVFTTGFFFATTTATGPHHAAVIAGIPQMIFAAIVSTNYRRPNVSFLYKFIISVFAVVATMLFVMANLHIINAMSKPINSNWDRANSEIADIVLNNKSGNFVTTDWGMGTQLIALTSGRIYDNWPSFTNIEPAINVIKNLDCSRDTFIINRLKGFENFKGNREIAYNALKELNITYRQKYIISNYADVPMIEVLIVPSYCE